MIDKSNVIAVSAGARQVVDIREGNPLLGIEVQVIPSGVVIISGYSELDNYEDEYYYGDRIIIPWVDVLKHAPPEALLAALKQIAYDRGGDGIIFIPLLTEEQREDSIYRQRFEDSVRLGLGPHLNVPCGLMPMDPDSKDKEGK